MWIIPMWPSTNDRQRQFRRQACRGARSESDHSLALTAATKQSEFNKPLIRNACPGLARIKRYRIRRAEVILPIDAGDFTFYDCAYEELLQALGAINDDARFPGPCSTTTSRWDSSTSTTSIFSIFSTTRGFARA